ncbi:hypothetical protein EDD17DRAFT_528421 [Pisolithus thermaeus]|nr:hypothetical protein EDD17DRAFT_528421 [Pisolithus thermaeus]
MHSNWCPVFTEFFSPLIKTPPSTSPSILLGTYICSGPQAHVLFQGERRYLCIPLVAGDRYQCRWCRISLPLPWSEVYFCSGIVQANQRRAHVKHRTQAGVEGRTFDPAVSGARKTFFSGYWLLDYVEGCEMWLRWPRIQPTHLLWQSTEGSSKRYGILTPFVTSYNEYLVTITFTAEQKKKKTFSCEQGHPFDVILSSSGNTHGWSPCLCTFFWGSHNVSDISPLPRLRDKVVFRSCP